eukprot:scaffold5674_cov129-Isochrysis_galbana.AAC.8
MSSAADGPGSATSDLNVSAATCDEKKVVRAVDISHPARRSWPQLCPSLPLAPFTTSSSVPLRDAHLQRQ